MRARAAWAASISIVTIAVIPGELGRYRATDVTSLRGPYVGQDIIKIDAIVAVAKPGPSGFPETVIVDDDPPDIQETIGFLPQFARVGSADLTNVDDYAALNHVPGRRYYVSPLTFSLIYREVIQSPVVIELVFNHPPNFSGGQIPGVGYFDLRHALERPLVTGEPGTPALVMRMHAIWFDAQVCPLERSDVLRSRFANPAGFPPKRDCRSAENTREERQNKGIERDRIGYRPLPNGFATFIFAVLGCVFGGGLLLAWWMS